MTDDPPLNLRGISTLLQVSFWRVRGWRMRGHDGRERTYLLPTPDVSDLPRQPLWSTSAIVAWAEVNGLWPVGAITRTCPYGPCGQPSAPLTDANGVRPHRYQGDWCPGGGTPNQDWCIYGACPWCSAMPGNPCVARATGAKLGRAHQSRRDNADAARKRALQLLAEA